MRLILQLVNDISRVFQKWLNYLNGTIISTTFVPSAPVSPVIFGLNLHEPLLPGKLLITPLSFKDRSSL